MTPWLAESLGWMATAVFTASYFTRRQTILRRVQVAGATMWVTYGLVMQAAPVVVANLLVLSAAAWAELRERRAIGSVTGAAVVAPGAAAGPGGVPAAPTARELA
jgi:hypothetical protein